MCAAHVLRQSSLQTLVQSRRFFMAEPATIEPRSSGQQLGSKYKQWTLDCLVTIAHAVSLDFSDRPELYQQVADGTASRLTDLQGSYGFRADFPDMNIRQ